jgi:hypothetical protein
MKRLLAPLAVLATFLTSPAHAAAPPVVRATVVLAGPAGSVATMTVDRTVRLGNGGGDVALSSSGGSWSGIVIVDRSTPPTALTMNRTGLYAGIDVPQKLRCPGGTCPYTDGIGPPVFGTDDAGDGYVRLVPGTYYVFLAGERGHTVRAVLSPRDARPGRVTLHPVAGTGAAASGLFKAGGPQPGAEARVDAFGWAPAGHRWSFAGVWSPYALLPAGVQQVSGCLTVGPPGPVPADNGVAPCADGDGEDVVFAPQLSVSADHVPDMSTPVGSSGAAMWGPGADGDDRFGAGVEHTGSAPSSWLRAVVVGASF